MAIYDVFQCNVCKLHTEKPVNQTHATLDKCTITFKCVGKLLKTGQTEIKASLTPYTNNAFEAWKPRTDTILNQKLVIDEAVTVMAGVEALSIAIKTTDYQSDGPLSLVLAQEKLGSSSFVEFFYNRPSNTTQLYGQDDSSKRLTLRFSALDEVKVYINGIELAPTLFDRSVLGRITLAQPLVDDASTINVVVFRQAAQILKTLVFTTNNTTHDNTTAWGNVISFETKENGNEYKIFTCRDLSLLEIGTTLKIDSLMSGATPIGLTNAFLLLSVKPYSSYDRDLDNVISLGAVLSNSIKFEYYSDEAGVPTVFTKKTNDSLKSIFPPIAIIAKSKDDLDNNLKNNSNTVIQNKFIT